MTLNDIRGIWREAKLREKLVVVIGLIYVVLPIDIVPELLLGPLGLLDDGGAIFAVIAALWAASNRYKAKNSGFIEGKESYRKP